MAKTLTDRTSVRVTAKSETDANNQKKNDANNIAKALGKDGDLDDTKASSVASKLGNTITDENGTTWAKSSEVAAAAKELDGEIGGTKSYKYGNVAAIDIGALPLHERWGFGWNCRCDRYGPMNLGGQYFSDPKPQIDSDGNPISMAGPSYTGRDFYYSGGSRVGIVHNINTGNYNLITTSDAGGAMAGSNTRTFSSWEELSAFSGIPITDVGETLLSLSAYGDLHEETSGGSKVDTSKSEAEIKDELESKAWAQGKAAKINPVEPNETYIAVTDANGNPLYFLGT